MTLISEETKVAVHIEGNPSKSRKLAVSVTGASDGYPIFLLHGTPGSRKGPKPRPIVLFRQGVRLICYDRPGYGESRRLKGRVVADAADDVFAIADALEINGAFGVVGRSGGGPHALAVAAADQGKGRVSSVATLGSLAPSDRPGLDWYEGMNTFNHREYAAVDADTQAQLDRLTVWAREVKNDPRKMIEIIGEELSGIDERVVGNVALRKLLLDTYKEGVEQGPEGWIDDVMAFRAPWGFDLSKVRCRTLIWHGDDDRFSPVEHSDFLYRKIGNESTRKTLRKARGVGHFGAVEVLPQVLSWVLDEAYAPQDAATVTSIRTAPEDLSPGRQHVGNVAL
jgi:pimeloyl-ACP methyl ester carboxylesterase